MANVAPLAPTPTAPDDNGYVMHNYPIVFTWDFHDPGDTQASATLRYKVSPAGGWSTWTNAATTLSTFTLPADTLVVNTAYEWQVQTKDSGGLWSPLSASRFLNTAFPPTPTITAPAAAATVTASPLPVSWTVPAGWVPDSYTLYVTSGPGRTGTSLYFSGVTKSPALSGSVLVDLPAGSGATQYVSLMVSFATGDGGSVAAGWVERSFTNAMLPVERPMVVLAQVPEKPEVIVSITNPAPSDGGHVATTKNDLFRNGVPIRRDLAVNYYGTSRTPGAGLVEYVARAYAANGSYLDSY